MLSSDVPFHDPLKKLKLVSFTSSTLSKVKISGKDVMIKADRNLFARLLIAAQKRSMDLREMFEYSLGPVPWSLASADGSLCKTDKSKLLESLTKEIETFQELALDVFHHAVPRTSLARRIDFVTDRYPEISIKHLERRKRARVKITGSAQKCRRQWKKYLSSGDNKSELSRFL